MKNDDIEFLFDEADTVDEEKVQFLEQEEYIKDPSLDDVFPDKYDVDVNRLLNKFEKATQEYASKDSDKKDENKIKEDTFLCFRHFYLQDYNIFFTFYQIVICIKGSNYLLF